MRLLNSQTFELRSFLPHEIPEYVILSHRWGTEELTYRDVVQNPLSAENSPTRRLRGFPKVDGVCRLASEDGYSWVWIDTCCIDKESSADVDKNINSMWTYYTKSNICYVYMADVADAQSGWSTGFQKSNWFTRCWTLQELVAPVHLEFYAADWSPIGTKLERAMEVAKITSIDDGLLVQNRSIDGYTTAERLSWAAHRQVTQEEDEAYSLLGLFQIHMPMLYGEGRSRAFARLQEAIYLATCDDSIFLFRYSMYEDSQPLIADCTTRFCQRLSCVSCQIQTKGVQTFPSRIPYTSVVASDHWKTQPHEQMITTVTPYRYEMSVPLAIVDYHLVSSKLTFFDKENDRSAITHVAILNHTTREHGKGAFCLLLRLPQDRTEPCFSRPLHFPGLLPDASGFRSMMKKTKILIARHAIKRAARLVESIFSAPGCCFDLLAWKAKSVDLQETSYTGKGSPDLHLVDSTFRVQAKETWSEPRSEVSCRFLCHQSPQQDTHVLVELEKMDGIHTWSIKAVSELRFSGETLEKRTLYLPFPTMSADRCRVQLTMGFGLYIGIRRVAASSSPTEHTCTIQQRYNIFIRRVTGLDVSAAGTTG